MHWIFLILAGASEIGFTTCMKLDGIWATVLFFVSAALSFWLLTRAMKTIPLGTAYAVWTAIVIGLKMVSEPQGEFGAPA